MQFFLATAKRRPKLVFYLVKIVEHPPDLRKLDGFGGAPPHSIRFPWYGDCKTDPAEPRAAGHPISLLWLLVVRS